MDKITRDQKHKYITYDIYLWVETWDKGVEVNLSIKCEQRRHGLQTPSSSSHTDTVPEDGPNSQFLPKVQGIKTPLQPPHNRAMASSLLWKRGTFQKAEEYKILTRQCNFQRPSVNGSPPKGTDRGHSYCSRPGSRSPDTRHSNWFRVALPPQTPEPGSMFGNRERELNVREGNLR